MKIQLWSVGKADEAIFSSGIQEFTQRISRYYGVQWRYFPPFKVPTGTPDQYREGEAEGVLQALDKDDYLVLLDERGKMIDSPGLAELIEKRALAGCKKIIFLIGGAYGVSDAVRSRAQFVWSFSALVFPHQLMRLMLVEQIYRACSINRNEKYHHI